MAKTPTITPTSKRLPKANIDRILEILRKELQKKADIAIKEADKNFPKAREAYITNAIAKHGVAKVFTTRLSHGDVRVVYSSRVQSELNKIEARYALVSLAASVKPFIWMHVPAFKKQIFEDVLNGLKELELRLLTADSEHALSLAKQFETTIKGIK